MQSLKREQVKRIKSCIITKFLYYYIIIIIIIIIIIMCLTLFQTHHTLPCAKQRRIIKFKPEIKLIEPFCIPFLHLTILTVI